MSHTYKCHTHWLYPNLLRKTFRLNKFRTDRQNIYLFIAMVVLFHKWWQIILFKFLFYVRLWENGHISWGEEKTKTSGVGLGRKVPVQQYEHMWYAPTISFFPFLLSHFAFLTSIHGNNETATYLSPENHIISCQHPLKEVKCSINIHDEYSTECLRTTESY